MNTEPTVEQRIALAHRYIAELCQGKRKWVMSIPARPDEDVDLVICGVIRDLNAEREALAKVNNVLDEDNNALEEEKQQLEEENEADKKRIEGLVDAVGAAALWFSVQSNYGKPRPKREDIKQMMQRMREALQQHGEAL